MRVRKAGRDSSGAAVCERARSMTISRPSQRAMRKTRDALRAADPRCHWCGVLTEIPTNAHDLNAATVDHVRPRRACKSQAEYDSPTNHVLACFECNALRDAVDIALLEHQRKEQALLERMKAGKRRVMVRTKYIG